MLTNDFDYELPAELIAQEPPENRGESRMMVLDPRAGTCSIHPFSDFPQFMNAGDVITVNNTRVIRARLFALKDTGAKIEIFLLGLKDLSRDTVWRCMMKPAKRVTIGASLKILLHDGVNLSGKTVRLLDKTPEGICTVEFPEGAVDTTLHDCGHLPLPPYIRRKDENFDAERYQTVYARIPGAVAAPTAGLHFTDTVFQTLREKGVIRADLTLHVGAGTFQPVSEEKVEDHRMHFESFSFPDEAAETLNIARRNGNRVLAVGTTSLRTLETCVREDGMFRGRDGETGIYIYPPYKIKSADMLLTNFHLPKSTLLMLVSAFAGMDAIREAYSMAVRERMRFFSYGDCMLILNHI